MNLKPCPFCGGEASMFCDESTDTWNVFCDNVPCPAEPGTAICFSEQEAIDAWNTRAYYEAELDALPMTEENMREYGWVRERTCKVVGSYAYGERDELKAWFLSCGHEFEWNYKKSPNYCPKCGARVEER